MWYTILTTLASIGLLASNALAQSNIDDTVPNKYAWGENVGWTNWRGEATPGQGVVVGGTFLGGFVWAENVGWINLGDGSPTNGVSYANVDGSDAGVNIDHDGVTYDGLSDGTLHGMAWGENVGWINFDGGAMATPPDPARIECDGRLNGYVCHEPRGRARRATCPE